MDLRTSFIRFTKECLDEPATQGTLRDSTSLLTRRELWHRANDRAFTLSKQGIVKGDRILISSTSQIDFTCWFWAAHLIGAVVVPVQSLTSIRKKSAQLPIVRRLLDAAKSRVLVVSQPSVVEPGDFGDTLIIDATSVVQAPQDWTPEPGLGPHDPAIIQFSSGSTGSPKGCLLSHGAVSLNAESFLRAFDCVAGDSLLNWMPLFHDFGLMFGVIAPVVGGLRARYLRTESFVADATSWLKAMDDCRVCHTGGPPSSLSLLCHKLKQSERTATYDLSRVRTLVCAAEPIYPDVIAEWLRLSKPLGFNSEAYCSGYGLAERP